MWLKRTEEEVMKMTPRKLQALLMVHYDVKRQEYGQKPKRNNSQVDGFIDTIPGW